MSRDYEIVEDYKIRNNKEDDEIFYKIDKSDLNDEIFEELKNKIN